MSPVIRVVGLVIGPPANNAAVVLGPEIGGGNARVSSLLLKWWKKGALGHALPSCTDHPPRFAENPLARSDVRGRFKQARAGRFIGRGVTWAFFLCF